MVNYAWSGKFLAFSVVLISYYGTLPDILMAYVKDEPFISVIIYSAVNTVGWVLAANFHSKVSFLRIKRSLEIVVRLTSFGTILVAF